MSVWSFCPDAIRSNLSKIIIKNKGNANDLAEYRRLWGHWIADFSGCETKKMWAITNGIHEAIINQVAHVSKHIKMFYTFNTDYLFYNTILRPYNHLSISPSTLNTMLPGSYVIVSQPNHEGGITPWFELLKDHCRKNNIKIFLDCAFYGTTFDKLDTSDTIFDAVAFSLSKNFLLAGFRAGIVFGENLAPTLTVPISREFTYNYFNSQAVECAKVILPNFKPTYITQFAKPQQLKYCIENNLTPADIWMWAFDQNNQKICITDAIKNEVQLLLNNADVKNYQSVLL